MNEQNTTTPHVEGPRWTIRRKFSTFKEANEFRFGLLTETDTLQVKVHLMGRIGEDYYAVKTRINPEIALNDEIRLKREEKKRRKARLNKKRRKK